jgi:cytochrome P450
MFESELKRFGDIVRVKLIGRDGYMVGHPDDIERVLVRDHSQFVKDDVTRELRRTLGNGLLTNEGDSWRRNRKLAAPAFTKRAVAAYADAMVAMAQRYVAELPLEESHDVHRTLMALTLDIVTRTMFGTDLPEGSDAVGHALDDMMTHFMTEFASFKRFFIPNWFPTKGNRTLKRAVRTVDATIHAIIELRRKTLTDDSHDLISLLLKARDDEGHGLSDAQIRDEAVTIFLAGHETTALALSYALHLLALHPTYQTRVCAEIDEVLGERSGTIADLPRLKFTEAVISEAMRLYPPAYMMARETIEPYELRGYKLRKGDKVWVSPWTVQHDSRWFDEPERFVPDRWLDGLRDRLPRFAYFPFGGGPRICIGNHFAMMEAVLVLATILQQRTFTPAAEHVLALDCSVTLRPRHGIKLISHARRRE